MADEMGSVSIRHGFTFGPSLIRHGASLSFVRAERIVGYDIGLSRPERDFWAGAASGKVVKSRRSTRACTLAQGIQAVGPEIAGQK